MKYLYLNKKCLRNEDKLKTEFFQVGIITATHGIHGQVKVFPTTDNAKRFDALKNKPVLLDTGSGYKELVVETVQYFKNLVILKFKGIDNINDIEKYKGKSLYVPRSQAVPLEEDEYYIADLIGLTVRSDEGETLGKLTDVLQTGANDVYVVASETYGELMIPAIVDCILEVLPEKECMTVHLLDGLLELGKRQRPEREQQSQK